MAKLSVAAGCRVYTYDLTQTNGGIKWNAGPIQSIAIKAAFSAGVQQRVDWARLSPTAPTTSPKVTAHWTPTGGTFDLFFDTVPTGANATLIATGVAGTTGTFAWQTPNLPSGTYYLIAQGTGGQSVSTPFVVNTPADATIVNPSIANGPDYATTVVGNPWHQPAR